MHITNLNIRTEKAVKEAAESIYTELGLNTPNEVTMAAIAEGRRIAADQNVKEYDCRR